MHARLFPKVNRFAYKGYYLALNLDEMDDCPIAVNRVSFLSFHTKDHKAENALALKENIKKTLAAFDIHLDGKIILVCMPRVAGYVFNPVSFFLCFDDQDQLHAYVAEVHNTFGERHFYVCAHKDGRVISDKDILKGQKVFHVSPFLEREGHYQFRISYAGDSAGFWIDYYDADGNKKLITSLLGKRKPMSKKTLMMAGFKYPFITLKTILLIHWQAAKLWFKKIKFIPNPPQSDPKVTGTMDDADRMKNDERETDA